MTGRIILIVVFWCIGVAANSQESINIELDLSSTNQLTISKNNNIYEMETQGIDPWVKSEIITQWYNPDTTYVIEFEYLAFQGLDNLRIYYNPFSAANSVDNGSLQVAEGWYKAMVILKKSDTWTDSQRDYLRFDFGKKAGQAIQVRNIKLRTISEQEYFDWKNPMDKRLNDQLLAYYAKVFDKKIERVQVKPDSIVVVGSGNSSFENCKLSEILFHENAYDINEFVFSQALPNADTFSVTLPRLALKNNREQYDRLYSRWMITDASGNSLSHAHWADDITGIAQWDIPEEKPLSPKGMGGVALNDESSFNDLVELGIHNITYNLVLPSLISLNASTITHQLNGKTYYINPNVVDRMDQMFSLCADNDIQVSVILLIGFNTSGELGEIFKHPDATGGSYTLANVVEERGVEYYIAAIDFLAQRYFRPDKKYGNITQWIIHNEVDAAPVWTNAGDKPQDLYLEQYSRSMRAVYYTARKYNPVSKVFISLTHYWNKKHTYKCPELLQGLIESGKREGDFEWGVAYHPYPENLRDPDPWADVIAGDDLSTAEYITPKNLELIDKWARTGENLYLDCKVRSVILSENGISHTDYSKTQMDLQAAGVAYYWKKLKRLPSIEAFHYHRWIDHALEGNLKFGLWSNQEGTTNDFGKKKPSWTLYKYTGTNFEDQAYDFTKSIIGINDWSEIDDDVNPELDLYAVKVEIVKNGTPVSGAEVFFNKEMRKTDTSGICKFLNIASSVGEIDLLINTAEGSEHVFTVNVDNSKSVTVDIGLQTKEEAGLVVEPYIKEYENYVPFNYSTWFVTGLNTNAQKNKVKMYPNPAIKWLNVEGLEHNSVVEIYSINGSLLLKKTVSGHKVELDVSAFNKGFYLLKGQSESGYFLRKVNVQ